MAKREISSTLRNLKFMQRASQREEIIKRSKEEHKPADESPFGTVVKRKCVVIMEGDPFPGAVIGRMSFGSFNSSVDKLNEAARISDVDASSIDDQNGGHSPNRKRKQSVETYREHDENKSQKTVQGEQHSSPGSSRQPPTREPKTEKLNWSVLRPKDKNKRNEQL